MSRKHREPPCFGVGYGKDCMSCKYTIQCKEATNTNNSKEVKE